MTVELTALNLLAQNGMGTGDFQAVDVERMMRNARNYINLQLKQHGINTRVPDLAGTDGTKALTLTDDVDAAFEPLIAMILRENNKTKLTSSTNTSNASSQSTSTSFGPVSHSQSGSQSIAVSASEAINNSANTIYPKMFEDAMATLLFVAQNRNWSRSII